MTVWQQDHPPLSRRQARDSARGDLSGTSGDDQRVENAGPATRRDAASGGRRVQWDPSGGRTDGPEALNPEPLNYVTQARGAAADQGAQLQPSEAPATPPAGDRAPFRVRDYRPEGRRASSASPSPTAQTRQRPLVEESADDLDYRTQGGPGSDSSLPVRDERQIRRSELAQRPPAPVPELPAPERTITRRELRALRERAATPTEERAAASEAAVDIPALIEPSPDRRSAGMPPITGPEAIVAEVVQAVPPQSVTEAELIVEHQPAPSREPAKSDAGTPEPGSLSPFDALFVPPSRRPAGDRGIGVESPSGPSAISVQRSDAQRGVEPAPAAVGAPFGHWSDQESLDEPGQLGAPPQTRTVGVATGAITTHALVLPSISQSSDHLFTPLTSTGEVMVTGSIDLPRSFGSTGAHPALFDHPDVDALIEQTDREDAASDSAPVRAIRAVSSNSSTRGVIEAPAPRKSRLPLILGTSAGAALLVVVSVISAGFAFNVF